MNTERKQLRAWIEEATQTGARLQPACDVAGISVRTHQRWRASSAAGDGRVEPTHKPANRLSGPERAAVLAVANSPEYAALPACQIVPLLADGGRYLASEFTFYRLLKTEQQLTHRQRSKPRTVRKPKALTAHTPNQIYSWDITYLPTPIKGVFLYLYVVMDIYSRKIVGWQVYDRESSARAADLMTDICCRERIKPHQVTLHSDNGSPMKGATLLATLQKLGVVPSFSRPSVSNDNPYSESLFRTLKYDVTYPDQPFSDLLDARDWVERFVQWYNNEHLHSAIRFVTPYQRHQGSDVALLAGRKRVYEGAKKRNPNRWRGETRNWEPMTIVHLNPKKMTIKGWLD